MIVPIRQYSKQTTIMMKHILIILIVVFLYLNLVLVDSQMVSKLLDKSNDEVRKYWTKERMMNAKPMDLIHVDLHDRSPRKLEINFSNKTERVPRSDYTKMPYKPTGRFFFIVDGDAYSCSSQSVGMNITLNAGHCLSDGRGEFFDEFLFCPQYYKGECPKGKFVGEKVVVAKEWHEKSDLARDFGFVRYGKNEEGKVLGKVVGSFRIVVDLPRNNTCIAMGFPANHGHAEVLVRSFGKQTKGHDEFKPPTTKFPSTMTFGSSGGGWAIQSRYNNRLNGLVSYGNPSQDPYHFYGPYFDMRVTELKKEVEK
jgi:V8-like Glu-specific endopeptidase